MTPRLEIPSSPRKELTMRALTRHFLAPLAMTAAVLSAGVPALPHAGPAAHTVALAQSCPPGTNWDTIKQACV
jgi:hypothetical protein